MQVILQADQRSKQNHKDDSAGSSTKLYLLGKELGPKLNQKIIRPPIIQFNLLRHGDLPREDVGAIEFWRTKDNLQNRSVHSPHWSGNKWKSNGKRRRKQLKISILY